MVFGMEILVPSCQNSIHLKKLTLCLKVQKVEAAAEAAAAIKVAKQCARIPNIRASKSGGQAAEKQALTGRESVADWTRSAGSELPTNSLGVI